MGFSLFGGGGGNSKSASTTDSFNNTDSNDVNQGNGSISSEGGSVTINTLDAGAFSSAVELSTESIDAIRRASGEALGAYNDVSRGANDVVRSSLSVLSNVVNGAFSFSSQSQRDAIESIKKTTSDQTETFSQSLEAVQRSVSSNITQGNTDIIKIVMVGLVGFGLVFALIGKG